MRLQHLAESDQKPNKQTYIYGVWKRHRSRKEHFPMAKVATFEQQNKGMLS